MCFPKNDCRPFGVPKQVKCAHLEPIASHFGPSKVTKCLNNGLFCDQKWVKNGSKMYFSKNDPRSFGVHKQVTNKRNEPILSPLQANLATPKSQNALKMGCFGTKNQSKMGQKCVFPKILLDYFGVHKQME